jgi:sigma-B regulation protein RsbU (phosphoserine phosphatase)
MDDGAHVALRAQLLDRRNRLRTAVSEAGETVELARLMREVDAALERMHAGSYGHCEICREEIEERDLLANPLIRYCLCRLTPEQQRALEADLDLATRIQAALLPEQDVRAAGWEVHYRYRAAGPVSGDYCDVITGNGERSGVFFAVGDVSGKGIAASLVMSHLNASFRTLVGLGLPIPDLMERTNRLLLDSTIPSHYATLLCGHATGTGEVEVCSAGHGPALVVRRGRAEPIEPGGVPLGMFPGQRYQVRTESLAAGDLLFVCTDGFTEAPGPGSTEYGLDRLAGVLEAWYAQPPRDLADACLDDLAAFRAGAAQHDDLTLLVLRRAEARAGGLS